MLYVCHFYLINNYWKINSYISDMDKIDSFLFFRRVLLILCSEINKVDECIIFFHLIFNIKWNYVGEGILTP